MDNVKTVYPPQAKFAGGIKIAIREGWQIPDLKVNDKELQTANLVYIFDKIKLSVPASKYRMMTIIERTSFAL